MTPFRRGNFSRFLPATVVSGSEAQWGLPTDNECAAMAIGNIGCLPYFLKNIVNAGFVFAAAIAVILIIISGIKLLTSGGDQEKVASARRSLTYTIIGLVIILLSFVIINLIRSVTGAQI